MMMSMNIVTPSVTVEATVHLQYLYSGGYHFWKLHIFFKFER
jgi:hypothetical protein